MKLFKTTDIVDVKIGELVFGISPLTFDQKSEIQELAISNKMSDGLKAAKLAVKYGIKRVDGIDDFQVEKEDGVLSDSSVDDLLNLPMTDTIAFACLNLIKAFPSEFIDPNTGLKLEGVEILETPSEKK